MGISAFTAKFSRDASLVVLSNGLRIDHKESLFIALLNALKKFERSEQRKYPHRRVRVKRVRVGRNKKWIMEKKWVWRRPTEAFSEKTLFLLDTEGNRVPLSPTKDHPERHMLWTVGEMKKTFETEGGIGVFLKALLDSLPSDGNLVLRFSGNVPT
ncbi:MAG: hypothetical protein Q7S86_03925 [bacterium]|nr:hypothetical protein [bacterium]